MNEYPPPWYTPNPRAVTLNRRVALGLHPVGFTLGPENSCCGTCRHIKQQFSKVYLKCGLTKQSHSEATYIRAKWPGCEKWEEKP